MGILLVRGDEDGKERLKVLSAVGVYKHACKRNFGFHKALCTWVCTVYVSKNNIAVLVMLCKSFVLDITYLD